MSPNLVLVPEPGEVLTSVRDSWRNTLKPNISKMYDLTSDE